MELVDVNRNRPMVYFVIYSFFNEFSKASQRVDQYDNVSVLKFYQSGLRYFVVLSLFILNIAGSLFNFIDAVLHMRPQQV